MTETESIIALVVSVLGTGGGARWVFGWLDRRQKAQHDHEIKMADRFDGHQKAFLEALDKFATREEERRREHLADARAWGGELSELAQAHAALAAQIRADSRRPPKEGT